MHKKEPMNKIDEAKKAADEATALAEDMRSQSEIELCKAFLAEDGAAECDVYFSHVEKAKRILGSPYSIMTIKVLPDGTWTAIAGRRGQPQY